MMRLLILGSVLLACCGGETPDATRSSPLLEGTRLVYRVADPTLAGRAADVAIERLAALGVPAFGVVASPDGELEVKVGKDVDLDRVKALLARPGKLELRLHADLEGKEVFTGADLDPAQIDARADPTGNGYLVTFAMRPARRDAFADLTGRHVGEKLAIVIEGVVESAPVIMAPLPGRGQISGGEGGFTKRQAEDLVAALRGGELPCAIALERETAIGEVTPK